MQARLGGSDENGSEGWARTGGDRRRKPTIAWVLFGYSVLVLVGGVIFLVVNWMT